MPLALEQASAYIRNNGITIGDYLALLKYGLKALGYTKGVIDCKRPVEAALQISIDKITNEAARQILYLCAYLAPENIGGALFTDSMEHLPDVLKDALSQELEAIDAWGELVKYSLLQSQGESTYSMHRLLQEVVREKLKPDTQYAQIVLRMLRNTYAFHNGDVKSHEDFMRLSPHVEAFIHASVDILSDDGNQVEIAALCLTNGNGSNDLGNYTKALVWYEKALAIREKVLGKEHPDTATNYNNIAGVYDKQGDYAKGFICQVYKWIFENFQYPC